MRKLKRDAPYKMDGKLFTRIREVDGRGRPWIQSQVRRNTRGASAKQEGDAIKPQCDVGLTQFPDSAVVETRQNGVVRSSDLVGQKVGTSGSMVERVRFILDHALPSVVEDVASGRLRIMDAYRAAKETRAARKLAVDVTTPKKGDILRWLLHYLKFDVTSAAQLAVFESIILVLGNSEVLTSYQFEVLRLAIDDRRIQVHRK